MGERCIQPSDASIHGENPFEVFKSGRVCYCGPYWNRAVSDYGHFGYIATRSDQAIHERAKERQAKQRRLGRQTMTKMLLDGTCTQEILCKLMLQSEPSQDCCQQLNFVEVLALSRRRVLNDCCHLVCYSLSSICLLPLMTSDGS